jgi:hypothetical protein
MPTTFRAATIDQGAGHPCAARRDNCWQLPLTLIAALVCIQATLPSTALANRNDTAGFGLYPFLGYGFLSGDAVDEMNKRLGNSARLSQPFAFGRQLVYGAQAGYWGKNQKLYVGASYLASSKTLTGSSPYPGVSGKSTLSLSGPFLHFGLRIAPQKAQFRPRKPKGILERIKLTGLVSMGSVQLENVNSIQDTATNTDVSYTYTSQRMATGAQLVFAYALNHWLQIILFDARAHVLTNLDSELDIWSYTVSGRNEKALAHQKIREELGTEITLFQLLWGLEITF